ncbi:hypothetical protein NMY22_g15147 [Coprinellus aureogranulatus]|nr:hypothetical protein NMY22_g15147 [Coprinellus aureogranulatus]
MEQSSSSSWEASLASSLNPHGRTQWMLVEADSDDFRYQTPAGEVLKVYRIVNAAQPTHGWIYKQYEGAHLIGYGDVYSPQNGYTDPEYARKAERLGLFHFGG